MDTSSLPAQRFSSDKTRITPTKKGKAPLAKVHPALKQAQASFKRYQSGKSNAPRSPFGDAVIVNRGG